MISKVRNSRSAFTLVEIMIVVAIIGLLAALAIPGFVKARKQSQGRRIINDVRQMDAAVDQWAVNKGVKDGTFINSGSNIVEIATYLKTGWAFTDLLNNDYYINRVGDAPQIGINDATKSSLQNVGIDWGSY